MAVDANARIIVRRSGGGWPVAGWAVVGSLLATLVAVDERLVLATALVVNGARRGQTRCLVCASPGGTPCRVCAQTGGAVAVGDLFNAQFVSLLPPGVDAFGENGEFHTLAEVWARQPLRRNVGGCAGPGGEPQPAGELSLLMDDDLRF